MEGVLTGQLQLHACPEGIYRAINITHYFLYGSPHSPLGKPHRTCVRHSRLCVGTLFSMYTSKASERYHVLKEKRALSVCFRAFLAQHSLCSLAEVNE